MAEYQKIEYRIGKNGKITETVLEGVSGQQCTEMTQDIESALGTVEDQELLPAYYENPDAVLEVEEQTQSLEQQQ
ncbi:DUF2997 domain-containing protein [Spirulina sp. CS-785/01]|uniref:DUF2997 domain-containing protein n=1 Tax=Spirulina sp. CS-785/01 TaxID=3021716 RepID=UPI00232E390E|nr:DUF2997 domain-containing protein [Spirulina sp. CS-785/01]MDB9315486.1 DUF2997 domain-containing protein [Spirulina sp. CS-785/01]